MTLVAFVDSLQRQAVDQVAFYPLSALIGAVDRGEIVTSFENGEPCGYLWRGPARAGRDLVIYQAVVHYDLRRRLHGAEMVQAVVALGESAGCTAVRLRCRASIDANDFWRAMGFVCTGIRKGGVRRGGEVNDWRRDLVATLFDVSMPPSTAPDQRHLYVPGGHGSRWDRTARSRRHGPDAV
jgi:ribosomal protein S18 acetylase RimI-like enzyme